MPVYNAALYDETQNLQGQMIQTARAITPQTAPATPPILIQLRRGLAESPAWLLAQATEFEPEPLSVERLRIRAIWSSERIMAALLELMASEKWMERVGEDYHLLPEGQRLKKEVLGRSPRLLQQLSPLIQQTDLIRFEALFAHILDNAMNCPTPPGNWCLTHSKRRAPAATSEPIVKIFHHYSDVNAWRDDSHMAAWRPYNVAGFVWEVFNFVCNGTAGNAEEIFDQIAYRGYSRLEYNDALEQLTGKGWIQPDGNRYHATEQGRSVFSEVEEHTNQYFYAPWKQLGEAEQEEFWNLSEAFDRELKELEKEHQPA